MKIGQYPDRETNTQENMEKYILHNRDETRNLPENLPWFLIAANRDRVVSALSAS